MSKTIADKKVLVWAAAGVAATCAGCWLMFKTLTSSTAGSQAKLPLSVRQQKLQHAEQRFHEMFHKVPNITCQKANELLQSQPDQYVIVDVRNKEEREVSMIPGSRVVTAEEFEQERDKYKGATAICCCTVGYRSSKYAATLLDQGQPAANLQGGILAWTHAELPQLVAGVDRQQPSTRVHTYAEQWAFQADGYQPVYYQNSPVVMLRDTLSELGSKVRGLLRGFSA